MAVELEALLEPLGVPDLLDRIADETVCTDVDGLLEFMAEKEHPALEMDFMF